MNTPRLSSPETPYIVGGLTLLVASYKKHGGLTAKVFSGGLALVGLIFLAAFSGRTRFAGVVRMLGIVFALSAISLAVRSWSGLGEPGALSPAQKAINAAQRAANTATRRVTSTP